MGRIVTTTNGLQLHSGGRRRPAPHKRRMLAKYALAPLPVVPDSFNYFTPADAAERDILGNDQLGDCTAAGACHLVEAWTASAGAPVVLARADAVGFYSLSTGYDPADPSTDQGGDEVTVCTTWRDKGLDGAGAHAIAGWLSVDPSNAAEVKAACWLFESLYFGIELDASWPQRVTGDGFVWDQGTPDPNEGHCIVGAGATPSGIIVNSWGFIGTCTWAMIAQFCADSAGGNLFAILSQESVSRAQGKAPNGYDWAALIADFDGLGGTVAQASSAR